MMWAYGIKRKITAAILLFAVVMVGLVANFGERSSANKINTAVASIYQDRLLVEGYIFNHDSLLEDIEKSLNAEDGVSALHIDINRKLAEIKSLNGLYAATQLTAAEKVNFDKFLEHCSQLSHDIRAGNLDNAKLLIADARGILRILSAIQMSEAKSQMDAVSKASSFSSMISQVEIVISLIVMIVIQILVISSKDLFSNNFSGNAHLN